MRPVAILAACGGALAVAGLAGLLLWPRPTPPPPLPPLAAAKPFSMEQFRKDSRTSNLSTWTERQRQAWKDCPKCPPLPLPDIPREEPAFEDVAPPKQNLPSHGRAPAPMPQVKPLPPHLLPFVSPFVTPQPQPRPKPAKGKGWDI